MFFSNTNRTNLTNLLGCDPVCIRLIREIRGQLNIIHTRICFSNTNRTNLTNLVGCDMVYIRGIREICGQLNIIHTRICFSNTNRTNLTNLFRLRHGIYSFDSGDSWSTEYNTYANMFFEH